MTHSDNRREQYMLDEDYFGAEGISSTDLKQWLKLTPLEWRHWKANGMTLTDSMTLGSAMHCAVLEPDFYEGRYAVYRGRRQGGEWEQFSRENYEKTILTQNQQLVVEAAMDFMRGNHKLHRIISDGDSEVSYFTKDLYGNIRKARADWIGKLGGQNVIIDLKTTAALDDRSLAKTLANMRYHVQAAWYLDVAGAVEPEPITGFAILWVRNSLPIDMRLSVVGVDSIEVGRKLYTQAYDEMMHAKENDAYPGYGLDPFVLDLPSWAMNDHD